MAKKTPLEEYILQAFRGRAKEKSVWPELEKFGHKLPTGGFVWTGKDLIAYFESRKKKKRKKKSKRR